MLEPNINFVSFNGVRMRTRRKPSKSKGREKNYE